MITDTQVQRPVIIETKTQYTYDFQLELLHEHDYKITCEHQNFLNLGLSECIMFASWLQMENNYWKNWKI